MMIDETTIQLFLIAAGFIFLFTRFCGSNSSEDLSSVETKRRKRRWKKGKPLKDSDSESETDKTNDPDYESDDAKAEEEVDESSESSE